MHVASPPPELQATTSHDVIAAIREDEDLRTRVCESSGPEVLTPLRSRVGLHTETGRVVGIHGDDTMQHTDMVIVEDTQGSPDDATQKQRMDVEEQDMPSSALIDDVHMDTLDLGGKDNTNDRI